MIKMQMQQMHSNNTINNKTHFAHLRYNRQYKAYLSKLKFQLFKYQVDVVERTIPYRSLAIEAYDFPWKLSAMDAHGFLWELLTMGAHGYLWESLIMSVLLNINEQF